MTQFGTGMRYGDAQFGEWQWEHTLKDISTAMVALLGNVSGIDTVFNHDPMAADIATAPLPSAAVTYKGLHLDSKGIQHEWLVPVFFDPSPERSKQTEEEIQAVTTGIFNAFMSNPALDKTCVNAFPVVGKTDYLTKGRHILFSVLLLTVETLVVRR
jgi:hypothetical protein